ncbi:hypothetical protein JN06_00645 [Bacteroides zoogleoformans]|uniref:Uncharacterized protein n=2 Tax=Bacteroides zoogleoformans TaxID=28119 RepID=A0ABN5IK95_9BACE|nr:hypothetical protein C4H11_06455 [Bacteroides zoogleoformans]TWJ17702.1 hypothetical protein JN06_00645 [Bacteroides zoogleoformans]
MKKLRNIMKWFLPLLFIAYWGGITLFTHSHVVNGVIISHSHPFKGEHEHSAVEVETIFFLSAFLSPVLTLSYAAAPVFLFLMYVLRVLSTERVKCRNSYNTISLRAPPPFF